jgi:enoyl-CoA hydratase
VSDPVQLSIDGAVALVTLNRPAARNALNLAALAGLADAWDAIDGDPAVRVAILSGAGDHFCAGADLKEMHADQRENPVQRRFVPKDELIGAALEALRGGASEQAEALLAEHQDRGDAAPLHWRAFLRDRRLRKPLIAAVEGYALGGGTELLQACDLRVAGSSASFGLTEVRWGLFPLGGSTARLPRQIPYTKAMELLLTGARISADEAKRCGLIGKVVEPGEALAAARAWAEQIAANGPFAVQQVLASVRAAQGLPDEEAVASVDAFGLPVLNSRDAREGAEAFRAQRDPVFRGE